MVKRKKNKRGIIRKILHAVVLLFLISFTYLLLCKWIFPPVTVTQLTSLLKGEGLHRNYVNWSEISPNVKLAAIASEDQLFPTHEGFDWKAIEKSMDNTSGKRRRPRGAAASTITQQTAKNVFLWQGNGWSRYLRKAPEAFYTKLIEWIWGKKRILEIYLNVIEMGKGIYGIEAASQAYFHKSARQLSAGEAAMIIACLPNPKVFTVVPASKRVQWRAPAIMRQMKLIHSDPEVLKLLQ